MSTTEKRTPHDTDHPANGSFCARCRTAGFTDDVKKAQAKEKKK